MGEEGAVFLQKERQKKEERKGKETKRVVSIEMVELTEDSLQLDFHQIILPRSTMCAIPDPHKDKLHRK